MVHMFFSGIKEFWRETCNRKLVTVASAVECTQQDEIFWLELLTELHGMREEYFTKESWDANIRSQVKNVKDTEKLWIAIEKCH